MDFASCPPRCPRPCAWVGTENHKHAKAPTKPANNKCGLIMALSFLSEIPVHSLDECCGIAVPRVVIQCRLGRLDLIERHSALDHVLNPIANDHDHVAVLQDICFIADASVTGNDICASLLQIFRDGDIEHLVQAGDETVNAATSFRVDDGIRRRYEKVPGNQNVGAPEVDENITIGMSGWKVI